MKPIVIILEGINAVGKTTIARILSERCGLPVVRPFRQSSRTGDILAREKLKQLRVPVNTYVDDFYVADLLVQTAQGAILDRSVGSGVAYGMYHQNTVKNVEEGKAIVSAWVETLSRFQGVVLYVYLQCNAEVRAERLKQRGELGPMDPHLGQIQAVLESISFEMEFTKMIMDTSDKSPEMAANSIYQLVEIMVK